MASLRGTAIFWFVVGILSFGEFSPLKGQTPKNPYLLILGTAQDGGLPQVGCNGANCKLARSDSSAKRLITSLLLVDPKAGKRWLFEATPDLREQVTRMEGHPANREKVLNGRPPLVEGIFLTHAHMGHYSGLLHLGREAYGHPRVPVYGSNSLVNFLRSNQPWRLLSTLGHIDPIVLSKKTPLTLGKNLSVLPIKVPHRDELSDTVGFLITGPDKKVLFIPDIDKWSKWDQDIRKHLASVDIALLDGTFFADGEIPGRAMADIPHPFISETIALFKNLPLTQRNKVVFIHLNHTNPVVNPKSKETETVLSSGMAVAQDMQIILL